MNMKGSLEPVVIAAIPLMPGRQPLLTIHKRISRLQALTSVWLALSATPAGSLLASIHFVPPAIQIPPSMQAYSQVWHATNAIIPALGARLLSTWRTPTAVVKRDASIMSELPVEIVTPRSCLLPPASNAMIVITQAMGVRVGMTEPFLM